MGLAVIAFLVGVSLAGARAETGLQRFESQIKPQLEFKKFTYATASTLGDKGFVLNGVVLVVPGSDATKGKDTTVKIEKVTVEEVDFDRLKKEGHNADDVPRFVKLRIDRMEGDEVLSGMLVPYGVPKAPVDLAVDYRLDTDKKVLTISAIEFGLGGEGKVKLSLVLDGVSDKASEVIGGAKDNVRLRTAELLIDDAGLIAKLLPAIAQQQGAAVEALVGMAVVPIAGFASGQGPATLKALDAVVSFIGDWKKPKGPIKLAITPAKGASFNDLEKISQPNALVDIFGLSVDYPGTRPGAASAGAATGGGSATATPDTGTKAAPSGKAPKGSRQASKIDTDDEPTGKTLTGGEAWMSIVGNTLTGKVDGNLIFEYYRKDGTLALEEDDEISKGKWSLEGEKVCFKYPDEDKDCLSLRRVGNEVTFFRGKEKVYRLKLLEGNPKNF
jgi:hypothetical protein